MEELNLLNKMTSEAKMMNIIRQLTLISQDLRNEDIDFLCDNICDLIESVAQEKQQRKPTLVSKVKNFIMRKGTSNETIRTGTSI